MKKLFLFAFFIHQSLANDFIFAVESFNDAILSNPHHQKIAKLCKLEVGEIFGNVTIQRLNSNNPTINQIINADIPTLQQIINEMSLNETVENLEEFKNDASTLEHLCGMTMVTEHRIEIKDLGNYQGLIQISVENKIQSVNGNGEYTQELYVFNSNGKKLSFSDLFHAHAYGQLQSALLPKFLKTKGAKNIKACSKSNKCRGKLSSKNFEANLKKALITNNFYFDPKGNLHFVYSYHDNSSHPANPLVNDSNPELELILTPAEYQSAVK